MSTSRLNRFIDSWVIGLCKVGILVDKVESTKDYLGQMSTVKVDWKARGKTFSLSIDNAKKETTLSVGERLFRLSDIYVINKVATVGLVCTTTNEDHLEFMF